MTNVPSARTRKARPYRQPIEPRMLIPWLQNTAEAKLAIGG